MHQTAVRLAAAGLALGLALAVLAPRAHAASGAAAAPPAAPPGAPAVLPKVDAKAEAMAKKLEARADLALKDSRLDEAIDLYKEAYKLARRSADLLALGRLQYKKAESLFMPGATLEVLARAKLVYLEARASLEEWAKLEPTAPVHAEVLIILDDVAGKLKRVGDLLAPKASAGPAEVRVGRITVTANVEGASVLLDGVKVGKTPLVLEAVEVGDHTVAVAKLGTSPYTTSVVVVAEKTVELTVELEGLKPLAAPDLGGAGGGAGGVGGTGLGLGGAGGGGGGAAGGGTAGGGTGVLGRWWFWTGVGAVLIGAGVLVAYAASGGQPPLPPGTVLTFTGARPIFEP